MNIPEIIASTFKNSPIAVAIARLEDSRLVAANDAFLKLFGFELQEVIGRTSAEMGVWTASAQRQAMYSELGQVGAVSAFEAEYRSNTGKTGYIQISASQFADGDERYVVGIITEITERKRAEQALRKSESRFRAVVEDLTEVICRILPDGTFLYVNEVYCRLFGQSSEALLGTRWHPVVHPDDLPIVKAKLGEMSPDHPVVVVENRVHVANGEQRWMQFVNRGFFDPGGRLEYIQAVGRDITERKQMELALKEQEQRLELALAGSGLSLWDWDLTTGNVLFSKRWYEMLGHPPQATAEHVDHWKRQFNPDDLIRVERLVAACLAGETPVLQSEHRIRHREGHWVTVEATGKITQRDANGNPLRIVGTVLDISHKKRLNEEGLDLLKQIESMIRQTSSTSAETAPSSALERLTKRERQILGMIAEGMTSARIGQHLRLSSNTIVSHRKNLMAKLDLHTAAEVTRFAMDHGLLKPKR